MFVLEGPRQSGLTLRSNERAAPELGADRLDRVSPGYDVHWFGFREANKGF